MRRLISIILFTLLTSLFSLLSTHAHASTSSLSVSPAILEKVLEPDATATSSAIITNNTNFPLPIKAQVDAFVSNNNLTKLESSVFNSSSWFSLEPSDFILQPLESKEIQIKITPPSDVEPGGHYATIYFQPLIPAEIVSTSSTISLARVGILSLLIVKGDISKRLTIEDFSVKPWQSFGPIEFDLKLKNEGNVHLNAAGNIVIKNLFEKPIKTIDIASSIILPTTSNPQNIIWDKQLLFGRYTASLTIDYGENQSSLTYKPLVFWVIPWPLILIVLALLTLIYKVFILNFKRLKLALKVLIGKDEKITQTTQENNRLHPRSRSRTDSSYSRPKRHKRR